MFLGGLITYSPDGLITYSPDGLITYSPGGRITCRPSDGLHTVLRTDYMPPSDGLHAACGGFHARLRLDCIVGFCYSDLPYLDLLRLCHKNRFSPGEITEEEMNREYKEIFLKD